MGKLPVHIAMGAPLIQDDGVEVGTWYHNEIAFLQAHVRIKICREKTTRLVSLYPADEHQGLPRPLSIYLVNVQLVSRVGEIDEMLFFAQCRGGKSESQGEGHAKGKKKEPYGF